MLRRRRSGPVSTRLRARARGGALAGALVAAFVVGGGATPADAASGQPRVENLLIDPEGLPDLHEVQDDGEPVMWLPQLRLFDAEGRPIWDLTLMPATRKDFRREIERRVEGREPLEEGRTLRQEARYFLRRGGLPINLTTLPPADLTVVEYWTDGCGQCEDLKKELDRFFARAQLPSVQVFRIYVDLEKYSGQSY